MITTQLSTILNHVDFNDEDNCPWQSIMNVGYSHWQRSDGLHYHDIADFLNDNFGPLAKMSLLLGKWNQQVENGGCFQYFDNGYASRESAGGCFTEHNDIELHHELVALVEEYLDVPCKSELLSILKMFTIEEETIPCEYCDGSGQVECEYDDDEEEGFEIDDCPDCCGTGESNQTTWVVVNPKPIDSRYYKMNAKMMEEVVAFYAKILS